MALRPFIPIYVGDWLRECAGCSLASQGLWLRMCFLMHDSERYGHLATDGKPTPPEIVAASCGSTPADYLALLVELDRHKVPSRTRNGIIFSAPMVREERKRQLCSAAGRRGGGNPTFKRPLKGDVLTPSDIEGESSPRSSDESTRETKPRDLIFEVVAELWYGGDVADPHRSLANRITADLKALNATPDEVRNRLARARIAWPKMTVTGTALVKHWHEFATSNGRPAKSVSSQLATLQRELAEAKKASRFVAASRIEAQIAQLEAKQGSAAV